LAFSALFHMALTILKRFLLFNKAMVFLPETESHLRDNLTYHFSKIATHYLRKSTLSNEYLYHPFLL